MLNGDGLRVVLWVAGCSHCCKDCHNPVTWDPNGGLYFDESAKAELFEELKKDYVSGITFSGGDPLHIANVNDITIHMKTFLNLPRNNSISANLNTISSIIGAIKINSIIVTNVIDVSLEASVCILLDKANATHCRIISCSA